MAVPIFVWNGTAWEATGPTIPANPIKYQASAPSSPSTGDIWVDSDADVTSGSQQFQRFRFVASGGETTISGNDANGATLAYTAGAELVVLNGSTLVRGQDYTATNGTSITGLSPALVANDVLEVFSFIAFNVANTYTQSQVDGLLDSYVGLRLITPTSVTGGTVGTTGAVTLSSATSVSLNGCFNSTYDCYRIILNLDPNGTGYNSITGRLRASGTDASGANYSYYGMYVDSASGPARDVGTNITSMSIADTNTGGGFTTIEIANPFVAKRTFFNVTRNNATSANTGYQYFLQGGTHGLTTSYDGITFNFTYAQSGTIRVYGFKN
jgi:hypothetical protein